MSTTIRICLKRQKCFKRTVKNAQVAPRAIILHDGDHRLSHGRLSSPSSITMCLKKCNPHSKEAVKFIGEGTRRLNRVNA